MQPVEVEGRKIAASFWGKAWCKHLESFSDYENRLPRGRSYLRNGSVCHLEIRTGQILAMVSGSSLYDVKIDIKPLEKSAWNAIKKQCGGKIGSMLELLQGKLSDNVMSIVTDRKKGLLPLPGEIKLGCSCPDWADMCKHVAAVMYGVGSRLDRSPELLFTLRGVDAGELITAGIGLPASDAQSAGATIAEDMISDIFGIDMAESIGDGRIETAVIVASEKEPQEPVSFTGESIAEMRERLDLTLAEFGKCAGVSAATVSRWESTRGKLKPHRSNIIKLTAMNKTRS